MELRFYVDDGSKQDMLVAELLEKYGFTGIFYIAPFSINFGKYECLNFEQIYELSQRHEIGGHTLTHALLTDISQKYQRVEALGGKMILEEIIGKEITKFAYPKGWHNQEVENTVSGCGFTEGRTMKQGRVKISESEKMRLPISVHFHPLYMNEWKIIFEDAINLKDGYFGVTCHGWELEKYDLWKEYEAMLSSIRKFLDSKKI